MRSLWILCLSGLDWQVPGADTDVHLLDPGILDAIADRIHSHE